VGRKRRPVLVLTRTGVLDVRSLVTIAEITTSVRGLAAEVDVDHTSIGLDHTSITLDHTSIGLDQESVVNCDCLHTVA
jgi:mRNA interferase MazF